jgi:enoyl-CoA hydratase
MYTTLLTNNENGIFTITINRPEKLNALNGQVIAELEAVMHEVYTNPAIKSVLLTGAGEKSFVAGADISEFIGAGSAGGKTLARRGQDLFFKIENCPKVVIACVNGFALGGGCELAMACHFRIASENAKFGQPEVNLGIMPGYGGTQRLVQLIGKGRALELMLTGGMIDASAAFASGLVNHVVMPDQLLTKAKEIATLIQSKAANAVHNEALNGYETELNAFSACFDTTDMVEGTTAFLEKRKPVFTGK